MSILKHWRPLIVAVGLVSVAATAAMADPYDHHRYWRDHWGYWHPYPVAGYVVAPPPPVVYAPPPAYYAPPPPVVYGAPSLNVTIPLR